MSDNQSDYNKPFRNLFKHLPEPYQSEVNDVLFHNLFNRFLSKIETEQVSGYVGKGNFDSPFERRQIREFNVHRQANQLQPILYHQVGSVEHMSSWMDLLNAAERLGVDRERIPEWLDLQKFNWVPPVSIDKIINFRNYFWFDPENPTSSPQYVTIHNRCQTAKSFVNFVQNLVDENGSTFRIKGVKTVDRQPKTFNIEQIDATNNTITVKGDATVLSNEDHFIVDDTTDNDDVYQVQKFPEFNTQTNTTTFGIQGNFSSSETNIGNIQPRFLDKIVIDGNLTNVFEPNFVLFVKNTNNPDLNDSFFTVVDSNFDGKQTVIQIDTTFTDKTLGGVISLEEKLQGAIADRYCICQGTVGWDIFQWDDNPDDPVWNGDQRSLIDAITKNGPPTSIGTNGQLWYDEPADQLYQYSAQLQAWKVLWNNFSKLLNDTAGRAFWDLTPGCGQTTVVDAGDQWVSQNKWLHRNDVPSFSIAKKAQAPIIEYDWDLELNEWLYVPFKWKYRSESLDQYHSVDVQPFLIELTPLSLWELDNSGTYDTIIFDERYGDMTDWFVPGARFLGVNQTDIIEVVDSEYVADGNSLVFRTNVRVKQDIASSDLQPGIIRHVQASPTPIRPLVTSQGDPWEQYGLHWLLEEQQQAIPTTHQPVNPLLPIDEQSIPINDALLDANIKKSTFAQQFNTKSDNPTKVYELLAPAFDIQQISSGNLIIQGDVTDQFFEDGLIIIKQSSFNDGTYLIENVSFNPNTTLTTVGVVDGQNLTDENNGIVRPVESGSYRRLRHRALTGFDDVRVYVNGVRQYGNFDELEDVVVNVTDIQEVSPTTSPRTFEVTVDADVSGSLNVDDVVRYEQDTQINGSSYRVTNINGNVITVEQNSFTNLANSSGTGVLYGITTPITDVDGGTSFVRGIQFLPGVSLEKFDTILIEVAENANSDLGFASVPVRTIENDGDFAAEGQQTVSLINFKKSEQVKTRDMQFPLFDIYRVTGEPANRANQIFTYQTDPEADVSPVLRDRVVVDPTFNDYGFEQLLLDEQDRILAYRDYSNQNNQFWFSTRDRTVYAWTGLTWTSKLKMGSHYEQIAVDANQPSEPFDQQLWYNTVEQQLYRYVGNEWEKQNQSVIISENDPTIRTIWRRGLNDERYQPVKRDWNMRSREQYNQERDQFVDRRTTEILNNESVSKEQAEDQALQDWFDKQTDFAEHLSPTGEFVGDWEIPDPLYFNHMHENRRVVTSRGLLTHFSTIIDNQQEVPGFTGRSSDMFRLLTTDEVNYGVGGRIKEFNGSFDNWLSSLFVNDVTPTTLIDFANRQYQFQLNNVQELYRQNLLELLTNVQPEALVDFSSFATQTIISQFEQNSSFARIYGDTTAFTEKVGTDQDLGIRNWIATLPHLNVVKPHRPIKTFDSTRNINDVIHHDGHRDDYQFEPGLELSIIDQLINTNDARVNDDTFGRSSDSLPPNTNNEFAAKFNSSIENRRGVFWFTNGKLYRLNVVSSGTNEPSSTFDDGSLWFDTTRGLETLRIKQTNPVTDVIEWNAVPGLQVGDGRLHNGTDSSDVTTATISAWQIIDISDVLTDIIFQIENKLYQNAKNIQHSKQIAYDFEQLQQQFPELYEQQEKQEFLAFVGERQIRQPFANSEFTSSDPFTWNYKFSVVNNGFTIIQADSQTNSFIIGGDHVELFDPCTTNGSCPSQIKFFVKNSGVNDGTWSTLTSTNNTFVAEYDSTRDQTTIYVDKQVADSTSGTIYRGMLPSPQNEGDESGGDWRDYYNKLYGTPHPHLQPWRLQGYNDKPQWWDIQYYNDDTDKWGQRRWKYSHGFDLVGADSTNNTFTISGDFRDVFTPGIVFTIDKSNNHSGKWLTDTFAPVKAVNPGIVNNASIEVDGDVTNTLFNGKNIAIVNNTNQLTKLLSVVSSNYQPPPNGDKTVVQVLESIDSSVGYDAISGSIFDQTNNQLTIRIDTTASSPVNDSVTTNNAIGRIAKAVGMWDNIRRGAIPAGEVYPNGVVSVTGIPTIDRDVHQLTAPNIPTYNYFSVNIDNDYVSSDGGITKFFPDDVFPPFWNFTAHFGSGIVNSFDRPIRSVFHIFSTEIVSPSADFSFGDSGPVEWMWRSSAQFLYDKLKIAFKLDPVRLFNNVFGIDFVEVDGLLVNRDTEQVFSHNNVKFHGEVVNNQPIKFNGLNQWYVNYNRFSNLDTSYSDFRPLWTEWEAPLTYQFSSFVDTQSLSVAHRNVCMSDFDFNITAKNASGVEDHWIHSFDITVLQMPPAIARFDNQSEWKFEVKTPVSGQQFTYYDVHNYQFYVDTQTNTCTIFTYDIKDVDIINNYVSVRDDQTTVFAPGTSITIKQSTGNDGNFTVKKSTFNQVENLTVVTIEEPTAITNTTSDGLISANFRTLPWETGDKVIFTNDQTLPSPLQEATANNRISQYFFIRIDDFNFKVARTFGEALTGDEIDIQTTGRGNSYVGQLNATFRAFGGENVSTSWKHFAVDTRNTLTFTPPFNIQGVQNLINIIDGYEQYLEDQGWRINEDNSLRDPNNPERIVGWQLEIERFIDFIHQLRRIRNDVPERYQATVDKQTNVWTFVENNSSRLITGDPVNVFSSNSVFPTPIARGIRYFIIRDSLSEFRLAATKRDARAGNEIDITSDTGTDKLFVAPTKELDLGRPNMELNPFRNSIWFAPERGVVSSTSIEPNNDLRNTQMLFDQDGRRIDSDRILVARKDKLTSISIPDGIPNDIRLTRVFNNPYDFLHLGSIHLFIDTYEHVLMFNNYTVDGQLLYDPFIGLNVTKYELDYKRQPEFTQRPNVGGHYFQTNKNQGAELLRNIEANVEGIRNMYDTFTVSENSQLTQFARQSLGFDLDSLDSFSNINVNTQKSRFIYWRGMIQQKGSRNAINAFVQSRRFIDANVDEFWAVKVAEFGSAGEQEFPELKISVSDALNNQLKFSFGECSGQITPQEFERVTLDDQQRWHKQPNQAEILRDNNNMHFNAITNQKLPITIPTDGNEPSTTNDGDAWIEYDNNIKMFKIQQDGKVQEHGRWDSNNEKPLLRHNMMADDLVITLNWRDKNHTFNEQNISTTSVDKQFSFVDTNPTGNGNGEITLDGDQTRWFTNGDTLQITSPSSVEGSYEITNAPSAVNGNTVLVVQLLSGNGINSSVSGTLEVKRYRLTVDSFVVLSGSLSVFKDGRLLTEGEDYTEIVNSNSVISDQLSFVDDISGSTIDVVYGTSTLQRTIHYDNVTSNIIRLQTNELVQTNVDNLTLWNVIVDQESHNPARIIDTATDIVVSPVQIWDPARGYHYANAIHTVDLVSQQDPAIYEETPDTLQTTTKGMWNQQQVGTTWLDTSRLSYKPYYDPAFFTSATQRAKNWGSLADWADLQVLTWVESDVPPDQWNQIAQNEETNTSIPQRQRKSGRVVPTLFEKNNNGDWIKTQPVVRQFDVLIDGTLQSQKSQNTYRFDISGLVLTASVSSVDSNDNQIIVDQNFDGQLEKDMKIVATDGNNNDLDTYTIKSVTFDTSSTTIVTKENVPSNPGIAEIVFIEKTNIYVNGSTRELQATLVPIDQQDVDIASLSNVDRVRLEQPLPTDQEAIDSMVQQGKLLQQVEHTTRTTVDSLGQQQTLYYFWVRDKLTRDDRIMSPAVAEQNLKTIPIPFMFTENVCPKDTTKINGVPVELPLRYTRVVVSGIKGFVDDNDRYVLRLTRDFTLRNYEINDEDPLTNNMLHDEWQLIREQQAFNIPRWLWDRITEAIVGFKLDRPNVAVPSLERELYDQKFDGNISIGLGDGQAFCDGEKALDIVLRDLRSTENDFSPIDIDKFFELNTFETDQGIIKAMNTIYNTFAFVHVNRIFFKVLRNAALTEKTKYPGIFKTSMLSLFGIRPFEVAGVFDD